MKANAKRLWPLILMLWLMVAVIFGVSLKGLHAQTTTHGVTLTWTAPAVSSTNGPAASYSVLRGTASGAESTTPIATGITATTYLDTTGTQGTKYFYEVVAVNSAGTSGPSNEVSASFLVLAPPSPPTGLAAVSN